jgi:catechol 2,3-dioxygenase-like lactoylglutathione lyase family enzyme
VNQTTAKEVRSKDAITAAGVATVDMKLEAIIIPVSDVERAKEFYTRLGWRQDVTPPGSGVFQFTPHGSGCSVQFGKNLTSAAPGSVQRTYLIVSDIEAARNALVDAGIDVSEIFHFGPNGPVNGPDPEHRTYSSLASFSDPDGNSWLLQEITTRLPGRIDSGVTSFGSVSDLASAFRRTEGLRMASTRSAAGGSATRTGPTGTQRTWRRSRPVQSCRNEQSAKQSFISSARVNAYKRKNVDLKFEMSGDVIYQPCLAARF